jgi:hypothetical protein
MAASDKLQEAIGSLALQVSFVIIIILIREQLSLTLYFTHMYYIPLQHAGDGGCWDVSEDVLGKKPKEQKETTIFREFNTEANPVNSCTLGVSESERAVRERIQNNSNFSLIVFQMAFFTHLHPFFKG